jgi:F1F0 ATPase subunit 2
MNEILTLVLAWVAGGLLGVIFFVGLWWTVQRGLSSKRPTLWFLGSLMLRTIIVLAGLYVVSGGQGARLLACLLGFVIARSLVMRYTRPPVEHHNSPAKEARYAP